MSNWEKAQAAERAEAEAKAVWADASKSAQQKERAVWVAVCARQQADDVSVERARW